MKSANRELVDRLAAEYVLGTLRGRARRRFERWLLSPQVGAIVKGWEDRLSGLEPALRGVTPPSTVWRGIETRLELKKLNRAPTRKIRNRTSRRRAAATRSAAPKANSSACRTTCARR